ncbi:hypothetical protein K505DRAFT_337607 [Melanomma pulvis-pyrius CBS 109.77]|uniref:Uncharacterized protein n=1 Tax=Melanomma pulvis-pyrius CBS 109.77 TaxID=1314802 RepID=A0A6A6XD80_9PLEO|nr:hypothetical protein K505DRAFT_337607 [Melanomma pulvis-pyrius CBS 109.77]
MLGTWNKFFQWNAGSFTEITSQLDEADSVDHDHKIRNAFLLIKASVQSRSPLAQAQVQYRQPGNVGYGGSSAQAPAHYGQLGNVGYGGSSAQPVAAQTIQK